MCSVARLSRMPVLPDTGCLKSFGKLGRECVLDLNAGEIPQFGRLNVVWRRYPQSRRFHLVVWWWCLLLRSRRCAVVRGCAGNGHSPGETQDARKVDSSPGEKCVEEPGYIRPVLVAGPPVYAWA